MGALSKLDEFLLNPQVWLQSGTVTETSRNTGVENQEPNKNRSQNDPCLEVGSSSYRSPPSIDSDLDEAPNSMFQAFTQFVYQFFQKKPGNISVIKVNVVLCEILTYAKNVRLSYFSARTHQHFIMWNSVHVFKFHVNITCNKKQKKWE